MSEQSYNILNDFSPEKFNLLIPVQSIQEVNPIYRLVINQVKISTNLKDKDIYREKGAENDGNTEMYALTHKALMKLFTAANGQIISSTRIRSKVCEKCIEIVRATEKAPACGSCAASANVAWQVTIKFPELSGGWRIVQATREIDFSNLPSSAKPGQVAKTKEFASEHAESKALSRCIRKGLSIKNAYSLQELEKPFVVVYPVLDAKDADVKKALIAGAIASSNLLYGSGLMLGTGKQAALPEAPSNVDVSTGEIIDQTVVDNDYEVEPPEVDGGQDKPWEKEQQKFVCSKCNVEIAQNVAEYSSKQFGRPLCIKCQKQQKGGKQQ
jgi:hypothetical protein